MQATPVMAPTPPQPPTPPTPGTRVTVQGPVLPPTQREHDAMMQAFDRLSEQRVSVELARNELVEQLPSATGPHKAGLEAGIRGLNQQMRSMDAELANLDRLLALPPQPEQIATTEPPVQWDNPMSRGQTTAISIVFTLFVLFPLAIAAARMIWKRGSVTRPALPEATSKRLERIEQAVDSIAIEVERISEGQRFVSRLLERPAEPVAIPREEER